MPKRILFIGTLLSASLSWHSQAALFADSVVAYTPGTGFASGYDNPQSALGEPTRVTPGQFGGPVDPFNPPYLPEQIVSIGAGGSLTLGFSTPISDSASHPYGLDFIIFGNSGFQIVNGDFSGGGVTDGSLFSANAGATKVSVSADGETFYELTPSLAPVVDGPFPTDGSANFSVPLSPTLNTTAFTGKTLAGIRQLYNGSAGGAAYDISWARDRNGSPADLASIRFVRVDVLNGVAEVDGISAVPEPAITTLLLAGVVALVFWRKKS